MPDDEGAVAVLAACVDLQCVALGGFWLGDGLMPCLGPGGGGLVVNFDRGGGALMWRGDREFV